MFAGIVFAAIAAAMTALKTGNDLLWPCVALLVVTGAVRALDMQRYQTRKSTLTSDRSRALGDALSDRRDDLCRCARHVVLRHAARQRRRRRAHDLPVRHHRLSWRQARRSTYGRPWIFHLQTAAGLRADCRWRWRCVARPITSAMALLQRAVLLGAQAASRPICSRIFVQALVAREREAALAGQFDTALNNMPHGLCMFARRRASRGDESSLQRDDGPVGRFRASRRERRRHRRGLRQRRIDLGGERQDDPRRNREFAGQGHHHDRSRRRARPVAVMDVPADGRRRRRRAARRHHRAAQRRSQDQPSGALRRTDGACPTGSISATRSSVCWRFRTTPSSCRRCCSSTSISSSRSTTRWAIPAATNCCARSPIGCATCCARRISWRGSAATNSWCSSRTSNRNEDAAGLARRIVDRLSERYKIDNHLVEIGASVGIAMTSPRRQRRYAAEERRHGALSRQGRRPRHLLLLPRRNGANRRGAPHPGTRPAQGAGQRGIRAVLSAAGQSQVRPDIDLRGAAALESSGARHGFADRHHSGRRGHGPDRRSRPLDPAQGLHGMHEMAGSASASRSISRRSSSISATC